MTETLDESVSDRAHHNDERPGGSRLSDESADIRRGLIHLNVRIAAVTILRLGQCQEGGMSAQDVYLNCGEDSACNDQDTLSAPEVTALATSLLPKSQGVDATIRATWFVPSTDGAMRS